MRLSAEEREKLLAKMGRTEDLTEAEWEEVLREVAKEQTKEHHEKVLGMTEDEFGDLIAKGLNEAVRESRGKNPDWQGE